MIVIIDNYDSFTYNLYQYIGELAGGEANLKVFRNDKTTLEEIESLQPGRIVISPGPGRPEDGGISMDAIRHFAGVVPILGVCLGHQSICQVYGGSVVRAARLMHGKTSEIRHDGRTIFQGLDNPFTATRYHSLILDPATLPKELEITAWAGDDEVMGVRHRELPVEGVQFHPESILTEAGKSLLRNFLNLRV